MAYVLDASAILNDPSFYFGSGLFLMCPSALSEIKEERARLLVDDAVRRGALEIKGPAPRFVREVQKKAKELGENLSSADIDTLALALGEGKELITDDYGMQNTAEFLGIKYAGALFGKISRKIVWSLRCSKCGRNFGEGKVCKFCGGLLVRKALRKEPENLLPEHHKDGNPD